MFDPAESRGGEWGVCRNRRGEGVERQRGGMVGGRGGMVGGRGGRLRTQALLDTGEEARLVVPNAAAPLRR